MLSEEEIAEVFKRFEDVQKNPSSNDVKKSADQLMSNIHQSPNASERV